MRTRTFHIATAACLLLAGCGRAAENGPAEENGRRDPVRALVDEYHQDLLEVANKLTRARARDRKAFMHTPVAEGTKLAQRSEVIQITVDGKFGDPKTPPLHPIVPTVGSRLSHRVELRGDSRLAVFCHSRWSLDPDAVTLSLRRPNLPSRQDVKVEVTLLAAGLCEPKEAHPARADQTRRKVASRLSDIVALLSEVPAVCGGGFQQLALPPAFDADEQFLEVRGMCKPPGERSTSVATARHGAPRVPGAIDDWSFRGAFRPAPNQSIQWSSSDALGGLDRFILSSLESDRTRLELEFIYSR